MASTFDATHPKNLIVATEEGIVQQTFAHAYDEKSNIDEKLTSGEKDRSSSDTEVVALEEDGDVVRESGIFPTTSQLSIVQTV